MRGGIVSLTTGDALVPVFNMLARALAGRFRVDPRRIDATLEVKEGRLVPRFGVPEDALEKAGVSEDEARAVMRQAWAMARPVVRQALMRVRERWHECG